MVLYVTDIGITSSVLHQLTDEVAYRYRGNACMQGKRGNASKLGNRGNASKLGNRGTSTMSCNNGKETVVKHLNTIEDSANN